MKGLNPWLAEVVALGAQAAVFVAGLVLSLLIGMVLAAHLDGPGGLLFATVLSGAGLLTSAALSQLLRDYLVEKGIED
jgi:hypothetical protein